MIKAKRNISYCNYNKCSKWLKCKRSVVHYEFDVMLPFWFMDGKHCAKNGFSEFKELENEK